MGKYHSEKCTTCPVPHGVKREVRIYKNGVLCTLDEAKQKLLTVGCSSVEPWTNATGQAVRFGSFILLRPPSSDNLPKYVACNPAYIDRTSHKHQYNAHTEPPPALEVPVQECANHTTPVAAGTRLAHQLESELLQAKLEAQNQEEAFCDTLMVTEQVVHENSELNKRVRTLEGRVTVCPHAWFNFNEELSRSWPLI